MLTERVFFVGAWSCLVSGVAWIAFVVYDGIAAQLYVVLYPGVLFLLFGGIFLYTALGARRARQELLRLGERGSPSPEERASRSEH